MALELPKTLKPLLDFAIHVVVGSAVFLVVFLATVCVSLVVNAFDGKIPHWVEDSTGYAEMGLYGIDMSLFALFIISEAIRLVRGMWRELRS